MGDKYSLAWTHYRRRRALWIGFSVSFIAVPFLVGKLVPHKPWPDWLQGLFGILMLLILVCALSFGWRLAIWPCPRCGKAFRGTFPTRTCRHCGLSIWSEGDSSEA
jgi:hypothetical protein